MSLNTAQINQIAQQYGLTNLDPSTLQTVQNNSQGGANEQAVVQALQQLPQYQQQVQGSATATYNAGIGSAVSGLQSQQTNLQQSYGSLLNDVMGQGTIAMNTADQAQNSLLASRGITTSSFMGGTALSSAQAAVQAQNQAASGSIGLGSASDINAIQQAIAGIQAGAAGTAEQIPLQYGSLNLAQNLGTATEAVNASQTQLNQANAAAAQYIGLDTGSGNNLLNISNGSIIGLQNVLKSLGINISA